MRTNDDQTGPVAAAVAIGSGERHAPRALSAHEFDALRPRHTRVLRAALAMRGGVSLAVWIGGATAEMDLWRRIRICIDPAGETHAVFIPPSPSELDLDAGWLERAEIYARLLHSRGFDAVEFDVLAGASAGGLNAVMYATAQRAGADVDALLPVWRDVGSAWRLLRPPGFERVDSVLRGDEYFWPELKRVLRNLYRDASGEHTDRPPAERTGVNPAHRAPRITVDLSATLLDSEDASERQAGEGKGHFHFVGSDDGTRSEHGRAIPSGATPVSDEDVARLAYAARTTSSFAGAFEPALIFSKTTRVPRTGPTAADEESVDMTFAFHAHREDWSHPFRVVDGGVFDNVPIDRAFRAIRGMASRVNATRALLYLDPRPPAQPLAALRPTQYGHTVPESLPTRPHPVLDRLRDRQSEFLSSILAGLASLTTGESGPDEEDEVERFRLALKQFEGRSESLAVLSTASVSTYETDKAQRAYVRFRAAADLQLVTLVMADPSLWQLGTNLPTRSNWRSRSTEERSGLDHLFDDTYDGMSNGAAPSEFFRAVVHGPQALIDATLSLLNWVRALESVAQMPDAAAEVRLRLYAVLARATDARDLCLRSVLDDAEHLRTPSPARLADTVLTAWVRENAAAVDAVKRHWETLNECLQVLRGASPDRKSHAHTDTDDTDINRAWAQIPWSGVPTQRTDFDALDLAPFLAALGIPEPVSALAFWRITGDEPPARPDEYTALIERKMRAATRAALAFARTDIGEDDLGRLFGTPLTSRDKLAGTAAVNFGGFLAQGWRVNDWWWGRLDAAAGMTRFVDSYPLIDSTPKRPPQIVDAVQSSVLEDAARSEDRPFPAAENREPSTPEVLTPSDIRALFARGNSAISDLSPRYLLSIASRSIRITSRALSGSTSAWVRLLIALLHPLIVVVPLAATPVRAGIAAVTIGAAILVTAAVAPVEAKQPDGWTIVPGFLLHAVVVGGLVSGLGFSVSRWRRLIRALEGSAADWAPPALHSALTVRRRATWQAVLASVTAWATLGVAMVPLIREGLSASFWVLIVSGVTSAILARVWARDPSGAGPIACAFGTIAFAGWVALVFALPAIVSAVTGDASPGTNLPTDRIPFGLSTSEALVALTVTGAGVGVGLLLTTGWLPIRRTLVRTWLINALTVSAAAGLGAGAVVVISMLVPGTGIVAIDITLTIGVTTFVWGSVLWWLPEIPEGRGTAWRSAVIPDGLRERRNERLR